MALLKAHQCSVLLIDMQEKLLPAIADHEALLERVQRFIEGAKLCSVPVVATEHWPDKIGPTHPSLVPHVDSVIAKTHFDALREPAVRESLPTHRPKVLLLGAEAHICVLQTGLSLHQAGYHPILVLDGIGSRLAYSYDAACKRWQYHGLECVTMEMALFEWLETPAHPAFKSVLKLIK